MHDKDRQLLLAALPADDHISTLMWAFEPHAPQYESGRDIIRYYVALLNASAGRVDRARDDLEDLDQKLTSSPGSLRDAVRAALQGL
jgi:hypothetical protein